MKSYELAHKIAPELFVGYDFVGYEDTNCLSKYCSLFNSHFKDKPKPPLILHAGESSYNTNHSCRIALDNKSKRLGHGLLLINDPESLKEVKEKNILIEANPVSNWILGYMLDMRWHPVRFYPKLGVKVR